MARPRFLSNHRVMTVCAGTRVVAATVTPASASKTCNCHSWVTIDNARYTPVPASVAVTMTLRIPKRWIQAPTKNPDRPYTKAHTAAGTTVWKRVHPNASSNRGTNTW